MRVLISIFLLFNLPLSLISGQDKKPITEILSNQYEFKMISSGNNFPNFNTERDFLREIVVLLHNGIALDDIRKYYSWDTKTFDSKLGILKNSDYIKTGTDGKLYSNVFVCSLADGEKISKHLGTIAIQIADSIQNRLNSVIQEVKKAEALKAYKFEDISLLILSDVLLDNWQINNVESDFLKSFRTLRHGKHYYASFQEKKKGTYSEAFEIYGNQMENSGSFTICRYGNRRYSPEVVGLNSELKKEYVSSLSVKRTSCPVIGEADNDQLQKIADSFKPTLLKILNNKREFIRKNYQESVYSKEISFEEYFIWIYHFIYTSVTDELIKRKVIKLPEKNVAFYILKND